MKVETKAYANFKEYRVVSAIRTKGTIKVYRAINQKNNQSVILKVANVKAPLRCLLYLRQEYNLLKELNFKEVPKAFDLTESADTLGLVLEDIHGYSVKQILLKKHLKLNQILKLAVKFTAGIDNIHRNHIVHKNITSTNLVVSKDLNEVKIYNFSLATKVTEGIEFQDISDFEGNLTYISPEQTGRINFPIDYRSDLYSLGVLLYELFVGYPPFTTIDTLEMVHAHIAKIPVEPHKINADIPEIVSNIIMRLLEKSPASRYQSAFSLKADLENCLHQLETTGKIIPFQLGLVASIKTFQFTQLLYGRERETAILQTAFKDVIRKRSELVLISGYSGIGKSTFAKAIQKTVVIHNGYFIYGKFDQFERNKPYLPFTKAFDELTRQLLTESSERLDLWKQKLTNAFGTNAQVIVNLIPSIEAIIGPQQRAPSLTPEEAGNRFNYLMRAFIRIFAQKKHPLVIFLDDAQWADKASLSLIQTLMSAKDIKHLMIICAYRENEISASSSLITTIEKLKDLRTPIREINLKPITLTDLDHLIKDSLAYIKKDTHTLAELVFKKTQGNPFFIIEFLKRITAEKLLYFDNKIDDWDWNEEKIDKSFYSDNVADLIAKQINLLSPDTQEILKLAACIGNEFSVETIQKISHYPIKKLITSLEESLNAGFTVRFSNLGQILWLLDEESGAKEFGAKIHYSFLHDKVRQAAYHLLSEKEKKSLHFQIAHALLGGRKPAVIVDNLFDITNHFNYAEELITAKKDFQLGAQLNLYSGIKAKNSSAYNVARDHFSRGIFYLEKDCWVKQYKLAQALYVERAESEYLCNNFQLAEELFNDLLQKVKTKLEKIKIYYSSINLKCNQGEYQQAYAIACQALKLLNVNLPENDQTCYEEIKTGINEINGFLQKIPIGDILKLPDMHDKSQQAIIKLLTALAPVAMNIKGLLVPWIAVKCVRLSLQYGNSPESPFAYTLYGLMLGAQNAKFKEAYDLGNVAVNLINLQQNLSLKPKVFMMHGGQLSPWSVAFDECIATLQDSYLYSIETGDYLWGGYAVFHIILQNFLKGASLAQIANTMAKYHDFFEKKQDPHVYAAFIPYEKILLALAGKTKNKLSFDEPNFSEDDYLQATTKNNYVFALGSYFIVKMQLAFIFSEYQLGLAFAKDAEKYLGAIQNANWPTLVDYYFYKSLCYAGIYAESSPAEQEEIKLNIQENLSKLKIWATNCRANYEDRYLIVEAVFAQINANTKRAVSFFDNAIKASIINGQGLNHAIAYELASRFYKSIGNVRKSQQHMWNCYDSYKVWGALKKVSELRKNNIFLKKSFDTKKTTDPDRRIIPSFDFLTLIKATNTISSEIYFNSLLTRLLEILILNAGAQKGILVLNIDNVLSIRAIGELDSSIKTKLISVPIKKYHALPLNIINYVNHTHQPVLLNDATQDQNFNNDTYINNQKVKSILCAPIISQSVLRGIIYLENKTTANAFSTERFELITMLSTQAAISLQNALLYEELREFNQKLENLVAERTQELSAALNDLKFTQRQLIESEKMAALGTLVAGISHEINTPIGIGVIAATHMVDKIKGYINLYESNNLKRSDMADFFELVQSSCTLINSNLNRAAQLIKNFKEIAVDQSTGVKRVFYVKDYISSVLTNLTPKLKKTRVKIEINCDENLQLLSYPGELSQLVTNLVMNSIVHAFDEGQEGLISFNIKKHDQEIIFQYADNGKGIKPEYIPRIFEPFFTTKFGQGGSGLGLNIVYNIVTKKLGGRIECESQLGKGTKFTIQLPLHSD